MEKVNVTCRLSSDDVAFLDELAESMERDRSYLIKKAVADYIAEHRWLVEEVRKTQAEVADGQVVSEAEFMRDMKTWKV